MKDPVLFLLNLLEDEFRSHPEVRLRPKFPSTSRRSVDLVQDYDPEGNDVHLRSGVSARVRGKEIFFPIEWIRTEGRSELNSGIRKIREALGFLE